MIHVLSKETIDKIAAGEVAERPESVVKELLDNAIDAGADAVSIEVRGGGLELIRVTDNGCGIAKNEIPKAFIRHATSKLMTAEDIEHIRTMGFRGEALASIAAVSDTELISRTADEITGLQYRISEGSERASEIGAPVGTTVVVRDFLANVPVRRQFLKSAAVENSYVIDTVEKAALAHPGISISLIVDGRSMLHTSGNGKLKDVIYLIYGQEAAQNLIEVDNSGPFGQSGSDTASDGVIDSVFRKEQKNDGRQVFRREPHRETASAADRMADYFFDPAMRHELQERQQAAGKIHVCGFAAKPVIARSKRDFEVFFVNGRPIRSEVLRKAAEDAYAPFLMMHRFPMVVLNVELAPEDVDVNVHPRKVEVRFSDSRAVYDAVRSALNAALTRQEHVVNGISTLEKPQKPLRNAFTGDPLGKDPQPFEKNRRFDYVSDIVTELKKSPEAGSSG
ncbi:MAG: DNA mismatch repair endonuclease MutL, partial [Lachnospiraceae bacterium]|nr:DNA mismatch repair endonuclease MutL [Lachnospiraceae bacterium]